LEKEPRPLTKRKRNLQMDIQYHIAKLIKIRSFLARLQEKQETLDDDLDKVIFDSNVAKKYKGEKENKEGNLIPKAMKGYFLDMIQIIESTGYITPKLRM
jgi:hypothetical protein